MRSSAPLFSVALISFLLTGCAGDDRAMSMQTTVRDSGGIPVVENRMDTAAARAGWSLGAAPILTIGGLDAPESQQLYRVRGGERLPDGRIVVADGGAAEIRVYGADGALLHTHGRKGEGPGEFQQPYVAGVVRGDSVIVYDNQLRRISVVHPDGGFIRSYQVGTEGGGFPVAIGITADGGLAIGGGMFFSSASGFPSTGVVRPNSRYVLLAPDGSVRGDLGEVPAAEMYAETGENSFRATSLPFGRSTVAAAAPDRLWLGTGDAWELRAYTTAAALARIVRFDRARPPVTGALWQAELDERLADADDENAARALRTRFEQMPSPDLVPPYQSLEVDALGHVWVGEYLLPGAPARTYTIVDPEGRAAGRVTLPPRTSPLAIGPDYVLGVTLDDLEVERLTLWALRRPAP